jgi:DNA-binding transcriptional MerR regulator
MTHLIPHVWGCDGLGAPEVLAHIPGLTYRKLDYWSRTKHLTPHTHNPKGEGGSGIPFCWSPDQVELAARMFQLTNLGFSLVAAADLARSRECLSTAGRLLLALAAEDPAQLATQLADDIKAAAA